ncbi:hypothetical protein M5689_005027 [Euphorbia peplus]|nr:hypothetical protein M5689_005027 [Euphorbia peplus]
MAPKIELTDENLVKSQALIPRLRRTGKTFEDCLKVIAFWLWLESKWNIESIIGEISGKDDELFSLITDEAIAVFSLVMAGSNELILSDLVGQTLTLSRRFLSLSSTFSDREVVMEGISDIYSELHRRVHFGETSGSRSFQLNPYAREWDPVDERAPEEDRCLFLTFSNGYPLSEFQIVRFFSRLYGECIERVYVHWLAKKTEDKQTPVNPRTEHRHTPMNPRTEHKHPPPPNPPLFGKLIFKTSFVPALILGGEREAKFFIGRKPLWCKRFDDKKKRSG